MKQVKNTFNWSDFKKVKVGKKYLLIALAVFVLAGTSFAYQAAQNSKSLRQTTINNNETENNSLHAGSNSANNNDQSSAKVETNNSTTPAGSKCYTVDIPYGTTKQSAIWLYVGQTQVANRGITGKKKVCTSSNGTKSETVVSKAFDEVINVGTKSRESATTPATPQYTYEQALSKANGYCDPIHIANGTYDSTMRGDCVRAELRKYGY